MNDSFFYFGAFLLIILLLWLAWQRPDRRRLLIRMLATAGAVFSLAFMARPPSRFVTFTDTEAILLTAGYRPDTLRKVRQQLPKQTIILSINAGAVYPAVTSVAAIHRNYPHLKTLHVLGYGLDEINLKQLHSLRIKPHLNALPPGIISLDWTKQLTAGEKLRVTGRYHHPGGNPVWLYLRVAGKTLDSTQIKENGQHRFSLNYLPKQPGRYVYTLHAGSWGRKPVFTEEIPVEVKPKRKLRILLLPAGPSFEIKFLKNYLAAEQHGVALHVPISKDIYQTEWLNLARTPLQIQNPNFLQSFDLLISDAGALATLASREQQAINQAVRTSGLGLIIVPETLPLNSAPPLLANFKFARNPESKPHPEPIQIVEAEDADPINATPLPYIIKPGPELKSLVQNAAGHTLVAAQSNGWGNITVSLLPETYRWPLAGQLATYARFWSSLISQTARPLLPDHTWHAAGLPVPLANYPVQLSLTDNTYVTGNNLPKGMVQAANQSADTIYLAQKVILPHQFTGLFWPRTAGWHQVSKTGAAAHFFYVFADSSFISWQQASRLTATSNYRQTNVKQPTGTGRKKEPVPVFYFWISFLVCAGFLWLEEKW
ncbi:MAG: hypothetical protein AVDCRST_MAG95-1068 [uncultured Adhaeribacter sp.]|uniref:Aerotolerance regulator N-terminal domain-containing protein n=1 Tax=uncultured Adhaeribacter sp. TaxID=448109 RepID=A0A6J4HWA2_9BACT|nr:MAG: hypothetical protein AVDCRST_MAG95-1068 [uncultured Adhaeribacter sp.]